MAEEGTIIYSNSPNVQVADAEGTLHRAQLVAVAPGDIRFNTPDNSPNVMVADDDGVYHRAQLVAMIGGGGSDKHNKGWFASESALTTAYPTAEDGDFAIVGETDTVWVWDSTTSAWVDTDTKGQVTSVNGQTGAVTIGANDVLPSQTGQNGKVLTTNGTNASWETPTTITMRTWGANE